MLFQAIITAVAGVAGNHFIGSIRLALDYADQGWQDIPDRLHVGPGRPLGFRVADTAGEIVLICNALQGLTKFNRSSGLLTVRALPSLLSLSHHCRCPHHRLLSRYCRCITTATVSLLSLHHHCHCLTTVAAAYCHCLTTVAHYCQSCSLTASLHHSHHTTPHSPVCACSAALMSTTRSPSRKLDPESSSVGVLPWVE